MTAIPDDSQTAASQQGYRWAMLGGVWLLYFCFGLTAAAVGPLVPAIVGDLGISHGAKQLLAVIAGGIAGIMALAAKPPRAPTAEHPGEPAGVSGQADRQVSHR